MLRTPTLSAIACLTVIAGNVQAQEPAQGPAPVPTPPLSFYPPRAERMEVEGDTQIDCNVTVEGRLNDCRVVLETPQGYGFGDAALKVAEAWRMKPSRDAAGNAIPGGRITIPLNWRLSK